MSEPFIAEIRLLPYTFAPEGWLPCDGRNLQIAEHTILFAIIGTTYGGDGRMYFALPNLQNGNTSRTVMHPGSGVGLTPRRIGEYDGIPDVTLTANEIPAHNHTLNVSKRTQPESSEPGPENLPHVLITDSAKKVYKKNPDPSLLTVMNESVISGGGDNGVHENRQPFIALNYCIATDGIFPPRP